MNNDFYFFNFLGFKLNIKNLIKEIFDFIKIKPTANYKIIIGTDSEILKNKNADFVTALVVYRVGNGGKYFWRRLEVGKFYNLRDRILKEVLFSLEAAKKILVELEKSKEIKNWSFEIHVDIGENGETKNLIQEVVSIIRANNFEAKTKPLSYAASKVADRHI